MTENAPTIADGGDRTDTTEDETLPACWQPPARELTGIGFGDDVRPWNWTELSEQEADKLWTYLGGFVSFFNARYGERSAHRIPPCWPEHGPLVEEITTLAFARWQAFSSLHASIGGAQYFHAYTLPGFYERLRMWLGSELLGCQVGTHRASRPTSDVDAELWAERREEIRDADLWLRCGAGEERRGERYVSLVPVVDRRPR